MSFVRTGAMAATTLAIAGATLLGSTTASYAGTNGQQVKVNTRYSDEVKVCGTNHRGEYKCTPWFDTPGGRNDYHGKSGYWFKGKMTITGIQSETGKKRTMKCSVPKSQSANWTYCNGYAGGL
ncbi:hypothetical protein [Streptomyces purpureus]|uniref:Secreted protein n=1 Tax=Streptomyces purpureus TaxID=1951 RepID=A0A918GXI5_9ACTN|nr:hypothetical protein [Streptomyces purpureus]GGT14543.1 hypothetical protein GCM10014713_04090 [Streptomyces purpureus]